MKKYLVLALLCFCSLLQAQNVGFVRNAQYRITMNLDPVKKEWEAALKDSLKGTVLTNFDIKSSVDKGDGQTVYFLVGTNRAKTVKVGRKLQLVAGNLKFATLASESGLVICSGCAGGCAPAATYGKPHCDTDCGDASCTTH